MGEEQEYREQKMAFSPHQDKFMVPSPATWQYSSLSFTGAMTGILRSLGSKVDVTDVAGYTGQAFLVNVSLTEISPSFVTYHSVLPVFSESVSKAFGWNIEFFWHNSECMQCDFDGPYVYSANPSSEDYERAKKYFERIKSELVKTQKPIAILGVLIPEYFIVNGFENDSYLVSTNRPYRSKDDTKVNHRNIIAPMGFSEVVFRRRVNELGIAERDLDSIKRAIDIAQGAFTNYRYTTGISAFDVWTDHLQKGKELKKHLQGNHYLTSLVSEGFSLASGFLKRMTDRHQQNPQGIHLARASSILKNAAQVMKRGLDLYTKTKSSQSTHEDLQNGIQLLAEARSHYLDATEHLKRAADEWQSKT